MDETINPILVTAAFENLGVVLYFDGEQYRPLKTAWNKSVVNCCF
jgi:hypothetical protein